MACEERGWSFALPPRPGAALHCRARLHYSVPRVAVRAWFVVVWFGADGTHLFCACRLKAEGHGDIAAPETFVAHLCVVRTQILESDHSDTVHVGCVNSKCKVYSLSDYENLESGCVLRVA